MIAAELRGGGKPSLNEALGWIGSRVDDVYGSAIGRLEDVWIDPATGEPRWLLVKEGRFGGRSTLVPFDQATPGDDTVWIPYERSVVREAPQIEPGVPLTQQVEATLRNHYAANTAAAVAHGYQSAGREGGEEGAPDSRATSATVRLATAGSQPEPGPDQAEPMPPPQLPLRPAPPIDAPPAPEQEPEPFGYEPAAGGPEPPPSPFPPPRQSGPVGQPPQQQPTPPQQQAGQPQQPQPMPPEQRPQQPQPWPPQQQPPQPPPPQWVPGQQPYAYEPPAQRPQSPPFEPPTPQPRQPPYGHEPQPPAPAPPPQAQPWPGARLGYEPPSVQQVPPPPAEPDPLDVLAGLPPGHMVEIELSGSLTISGELRHARVVPPDDPASRR